MTDKGYAAVVDTIPTQVLLDAVKKRRESAKAELGAHATQKVGVRCTGCLGKFGTRELRRHKKSCKKFLEGRAKHLQETGNKRPSPEWSFGWRGHK